MSTCVVKALPGIIDIKRRTPSILFFTPSVAAAAVRSKAVVLLLFNDCVLLLPLYVGGMGLCFVHVLL